MLSKGMSKNRERRMTEVAVGEPAAGYASLKQKEEVSKHEMKSKFYRIPKVKQMNHDRITVILLQINKIGLLPILSSTLHLSPSLPSGPSHPTASRPPHTPPALLMGQGHEALDEKRHVFHLITREINGAVGRDETEGSV